jgi:hypothetical protein
VHRLPTTLAPLTLLALLVGAPACQPGSGPPIRVPDQAVDLGFDLPPPADQGGDGCQGWLCDDGAVLDGQGPTGDGGGPLAEGGPPPPQIELIALDQAVDGDLGGAAGADTLCQNAAQQAGRAGQFRAFLSTANRDARDLVPAASAQQPVVNGRGEQLWSSWDTLFKKLIWEKNVALYSFSGAMIKNGGPWQDGDIWHGTRTNGLKHPSLRCQDWTSNAKKDLAVNGDADARGLLIQEAHPCDRLCALVCVRVAQ